MLSAFITHPDCARHEMDAGHPECPERLAAIQDHLLIKGLLDYMVPHDAPLATPSQLQRAHTQEHVENLMQAAPAEGLFRVDPDTCMNPFTIPAARRAAIEARMYSPGWTCAGSSAGQSTSCRHPRPSLAETRT